MNKKFLGVGLVCLLLVVAPAVGTVSAAQAEGGLQLRLMRNFGYGGLGKIQGNFTLRISDPPEGLQEVSFYLDGELLGTAAEAPYQVQFHTGDHAPGVHELSAVGALAGGAELGSNTITQEFLSGEDAWAETQGILIPLLIAVGALSLLGAGLPILLSRKETFVLGKYGPAGGTVCPRCSLPFSRRVLAPNLLVGKLARCPHCGKISVLARASSARLAEAEGRYLEGSDGEGKRPARKEDLGKLLEDSRFED